MILRAQSVSGDDRLMSGALGQYSRSRVLERDCKLEVAISELYSKVDILRPCDLCRANPHNMAQFIF